MERPPRSRSSATCTIGWWYIPIFIFIIFAAAFSANETDGLDGLLGGVSLFAFVSLATVAFVLHRYDLAAFCGAVIGALLAFLWFNIYPAKFFMGDTGSMSLGITIGVIAMLTNTTLILPFFTIILVIESLSVIIQIDLQKTAPRQKNIPLHADPPSLRSARLAGIPGHDALLDHQRRLLRARARDLLPQPLI